MIDLNRMDKEAKPWDFLNPNTEYVEKHIKDARLEQCYTCEFYMKVPGLCKKCGCVMALKTALKHASCPIGKWKSS